MRIGRCVAMAFLCLTFGTAASAQTIDFETLPGGAPTTDTLAITTQYNVDPFWVTFSLINPNTIAAPYICLPGLPKTGWTLDIIRTDCDSTTQSDMPAAAQNVGCRYLTVENQQRQAQPATLRITYTRNPTFLASGEIIDIHGGLPADSESFEITALSQTMVVLAADTITAGDSGTGDGVATPWQISSTSPIWYIDIKYIGLTTHFVGFAFDNITPNPEPIPALTDWGLAVLVALLLTAALWVIRRRRIQGREVA